MLYNPATHEILWESEGHTRRPIASITKVMTVLVFLEQDPDLTRDVVISRRDVRQASTTYLRRGERIRLGDLLHLALVASDNAAARVLARISPWGTQGFVEQMNRKADELGLRSTSFADPSGLNKDNLSTPYDLSRLIAHATEQSQIATIMRKESYGLRTSRRRLTVRNTNRLLTRSAGRHRWQDRIHRRLGVLPGCGGKHPRRGPDVRDRPWGPVELRAILGSATIGRLGVGRRALTHFSKRSTGELIDTPSPTVTDLRGISL